MQVQGRYSNDEGKKGWMRGAILVVAWFLIFSLVKDLWQIKKGFVRVEDSKQKLAEAEEKNEELKGKLNLVSTDEYKEKLIREQLNMQKVGEIVAVLPKNEASKNNKINDHKGELSNWKKWWGLLK